MAHMRTYFIYVFSKIKIVEYLLTIYKVTDWFSRRKIIQNIKKTSEKRKTKIEIKK